VSENTKPEEEKLSDQEMFSPEISIGNVASVQDELPNPEPSPNRVLAYKDVTPSEGVKTTPSTALFQKGSFNYEYIFIQLLIKTNHDLQEENDMLKELKNVNPVASIAPPCTLPELSSNSADSTSSPAFPT
jgi:hypothetical protein